MLSWAHIEQWSIGWQYSSNTTLLYWVPQQALAGWIASGILLYAIFYPAQKNYSLLVVSLTALWSAFVTIGLLPYLLAEFILAGGGIFRRLRGYLTLPNNCGLCLFVLAVLVGRTLDPRPTSRLILIFLIVLIGIGSVTSLADRVLQSRVGIRYLSVPLLDPPFHSPSAVDRWLVSLDIILGLPLAPDQLEGLLEGLIRLRGDNGLWDLGPRPARSEALPLSDGWRTRSKRTADWSTRILLILAKAEKAGT